MYGRPNTRHSSRAAEQAEDVLHGLVDTVARAGRLATDVQSAASVISAAGRGVTLALIGVPEDRRDPLLSQRVREAVLASVTLDPAPAIPSQGPAARASYAAALAATASDGPQVLSSNEHALLQDWLVRLAAAG